MRQCCCTVCTTFRSNRCQCHTADSWGQAISQLLCSSQQTTSMQVCIRLLILHRQQTSSGTECDHISWTRHQCSNNTSAV